MAHPRTAQTRRQCLRRLEREVVQHHHDLLTFGGAVAHDQGRGHQPGLLQPDIEPALLRNSV